MSSPMFEVPEHLPIEVDEDGNGPAIGSGVIVCWCGEPGSRRYLQE
ncbi:hypothetical protein AB6N23_01345 [Cellulomonas sp. 179-A 9B4 NHS]